MDNSICKFEDIFKKLPDKKINVLSTCLFKLEKGYADFNKYLNGAKFIKETANKLNFYLLIFLDNSILIENDILKQLREYVDDDKTIFIKYDCPKFKKDENYHKGVFGTMIRFFPIFNFPNNPFKKVIVSDIDFGANRDKRIKTYYTFMKKMKVEAMCQTYSFLEDGLKFHPINLLQKNDEENISLYNNILCFSKKKLDYHIIVNYMNEIMDTNSELYKHMNSKTPNNVNDNVFKYGTDEYFSNYILYYYFIKSNYKVLYVKEYYIINYIKQIYTMIKEDKNNKELRDEYLKMLQIILHQPKNNNLNQLHNILYKIIYSYSLPELDDKDDLITKTNYNASNKVLNISKRFYDYIDYINKHKNYKLFDEITAKNILKHKGIVRCYEIYNKKTGYIKYVYNMYKI